MVRIINSQMLCASDNNREKFCYVRTTVPCSLTPRDGGVQEADLRAVERGRRTRNKQGGMGEDRGRDEDWMWGPERGCAG